MRELYGDEVMDLLHLADLLEHPEKYGCTIEVGESSEAKQIFDSGVSILLELRTRRRIP